MFTLLNRSLCAITMIILLNSYTSMLPCAMVSLWHAAQQYRYVTGDQRSTEQPVPVTFSFPRRIIFIRRIIMVARSNVARARLPLYFAESLLSPFYHPIKVFDSVYTIQCKS